MPKRPTAYSSSDTETEQQPYIKPEPTDENGRPITPSAEDITLFSEALQDAPYSPENKRKAKERIKAIADSMGDDSDDSDVPLPEPPRFQTQAELDEWKRHYKDLKSVRNELGRQVPKTLPPPTDANGDTNMDGAAAEDPALAKARKQEETRSQHVYLFQFPPVLPSLSPVSVKPDPDASTGATDPDPMDVDKPNAAQPFNPAKPKLPSGHVGKLRIHKSGKSTLDWGGTSLLLGMGADATFLQNVLIATVPEVKPPVDDKDKKEKDKKNEEPAEVAVGMGMGQVRGKFVVTPDWDEILK
jgi:DNA-directed RNA polymerase III subunit RPC4